MKYLTLVYFLLWFTPVIADWSSGDQVTSGHCSPAIRDIKGDVNVTITTSPTEEKRAFSASNVELIDSNLDRKDSPYVQKQGEEGIKTITPKSEMLHVEQVCTDNRQSTYSYNFPTIDFKFQNTGNATAFLKQFIIEVTKMEIDKTPVLEFGVRVVDGAVHITASNQGWGSSECQLQLREPTLERLYSSPLQKNVTLKSGETQDIFHLTLNMSDTHQLDLVSKSFYDIDIPISSNIFKRKTVSGIKLNNLRILYDCYDENKSQYYDERTPKCTSESKPCKLLLSHTGFMSARIIDMKTVQLGLIISDITYITVIEPQQTDNQQLIYPISRKISPGDVERFHIMIGASASAKLRLRFKFAIDKDKFVESEEFDIHVWNPRGSGWTAQYRDGDELRRELQTAKHQLEAVEQQPRTRCSSNYSFGEDGTRSSEDGVVCYDYKELSSQRDKVKSIQHRLDNYPFSTSSIK